MANTKNGRRGRKRHREAWRDVLDEFADDDHGSTNGQPKRPRSEGRSTDDDGQDLADLFTAPDVEPSSDHGMDAVTDVDDRGRKYTVDEPRLEIGSDDDNPELPQPKRGIVTAGRTVSVKLRDGKASKVEVIEPGQIIEHIEVTPTVNLTGELVAAGHGFSVDDKRSRPWKTAKRTHCAYCGGEMPPPDVNNPKYACEFDPDATADELSLIGSDQHPDSLDRAWKRAQAKSRCRHLTGRCRCELQQGCQCSGCKLRSMVLQGSERNVGNPPKCCSAECKRLRGNERRRWQDAVERAAQRGEEPPPEPEDRGLKFVKRRGPRSSIEGHGHRYTAASV